MFFKKHRNTKTKLFLYLHFLFCVKMYLSCGVIWEKKSVKYATKINYIIYTYELLKPQLEFGFSLDRIYKKKLFTKNKNHFSENLKNLQYFIYQTTFCASSLSSFTVRLFQTWNKQFFQSTQFVGSHGGKKSCEKARIGRLPAVPVG